MKGRPNRTGVLAFSILILVAMGSGLALWTFAGGGDSGSSGAWPTTSLGTPCDYYVHVAEGGLAATSRTSGRVTQSASGQDLGSFLSGLIASSKTFCIAAGSYAMTGTIKVIGKTNVTLYLEPGARVATNQTIRLLQIYGSTGVTVLGGTWVGPGAGENPCIEIDRLNNYVTVRGADVSRGGHDGILIRNDTTPDLHISIIGNLVHNNGRYGIQDFEHFKYDGLKVLIAGNTAVDNVAGGIYTNGAGGVEINSNTVRNSAGTTPGLIGIGVTNGENDTVKNNKVDHMFWYGIQVFYNNYTSVTNNYSSFNAGGSDQSGITNDHSFYDTISNNTVLSNGQSGVHVERSWFVSVKGNAANGNGRFGVEFYHGDLPTTSKGEIQGNSCSYNGQAGIILNSGADILVDGNTCLDNSGSGILLYNDRGQAGSSGNTITHNTLGDNRSLPSTRTQDYGIREVNQADNNIITSNVLFNNLIANILIVGPSSVVGGNTGA